MSSFPENKVETNVPAAAATEIQESLAQKLGGGLVSAVPETTVYHPEDVLLTNQVNPSEVMNDQNIGNGANDVYVQPEAPALEVVPEVMDVTAVVPAHAVSDQVAVGDLAAVPEAVDATVAANYQNNGNEAVNEVLPTFQTIPPLVMNDQNNGNDQNAVLDGSVVVEDENNNIGGNKVVTPSVGSILNNNGRNEVVTPTVVGDQNNNGSILNNEVVTPTVVGDQNNNGSNEVVTPSVVSVVGDQNNNGSEVVIPSVVVDQNNNNNNNNNNNGTNEVVTPSVVNYQNNGIDNNAVAINSGVGEAIKRKRGRPRKYPIGDASAVPAVSSPSMATQSAGQVLVNAQVQGSFEKRGRGRPVGSGKKHKADGPSPFTVSPAISGSSGAGFLPYVITVKSGEYVQPTLLSLSQYDKQVVCVLSASGTLSNVTLQQPSPSGGTVTYEGHFEILSLSGSFMQSGSGGQRSITGGLSVSLAVPNGCAFGGGVAGPLIADSDVQIIAGTFLASEQNLTRSFCNNVLTPPPNHVSSVGGSPPSHALLSESSGASRSPFNNYSNGVCNNGNQPPVPNVTWN